VFIPWPGRFMATHFKIGRLIIKTASGDKSCQDAELLMNPVDSSDDGDGDDDDDDGGKFTHIGLSFALLENKLLHVKNMVACAALDHADSNAVKKLRFSADSVRVTAGFSMEDWAHEFVGQIMLSHRNRGKKNDGGEEERRGEPVKFPHAHLEEMNLLVTAKSKKSGTWEFKETSITAKPYDGNADTTSKDLVDYYTQVCLAHVTSFIPNMSVRPCFLQALGTDANVLGRGFLRPWVSSTYEDIKAAVATKSTVKKGET